MSRLPLLAALAFLAAAPAAAQHPQNREGFWIGGGLGYGSMDLTCDGCETDRESGLTLRLAMGGTPRETLLLGAELEGWTKEVDGVDITVAHLSGIAAWYPRPAGGFFLKGGAGLATWSVDAGPLGDEEDSGLALHGAVGYDVRVGRNLSLTPVAGIFWGDFEGGNADVIHVGLSVTGH